MAQTQHNINDRAQRGFAKSEAYDQHRPAYTTTIVQYLLEQCRVAGKKNARIVDLAAGTGKLTESLAAREEDYEIIAIEPHDDMRNVLEKKKLPKVQVVKGTADAMTLDDESVDAVLVAQAFHWFANMDILREAHRVLQPHGVLGIVWNAEDYNSPLDQEPTTAWEGKTKDLVYRVAEEHNDREPRFRHQEWRKVFDEQVKKTPLSLLTASGDQLFSLPLGEHVEPFEVVLSKEAAWQRYSTLGHIAALEEGELERVHQEYLSAINGDDVETNSNGEVTVHGNSHVFWTSKIPSDGRSGVLNVERPGA